MEALKRTRRPLRANLTRLINEQSDLLSNENSDIVSIQAKLNCIQECYIKIEALNNQILNILLELDTDEEYLIESESIDTYMQKYNMARIRSEKKVRDDQTDAIGRNESIASARSNEALRSNNSKYPKIQLRKFDGDLKEWLGFWAQFKGIHEDPHLSIAEKFQYLTQSMVNNSKAQSVVDSFPQSDENYQKAIDALCKRFGREDLLVEVYVRELLKLVLNKGVRTGPQIAKMYDVLASHLRALESLGVTKDRYAALLFPLVESSLPEETLRVWQRSVTTDGQENRLESLMQFLEQEVESEERVALAKTGFETTRNNKQKANETNEPLCTAAGLHVGQGNDKIGCIFCGNRHHSDKCFKAQAMTPDARRQIVKEKKACYACLKLGHPARNCKVSVTCTTCGRKHYALMCQQVPSQTTASSESSAVARAPVVAAVNSTTAVTNINVISEVLLQTILVNVIGEKGMCTARLLFDSGAQRSYIKSSSANKIGSRVVGQENLTQTVFGGICNGISTHNRYSVTIESLGNCVRRDVEFLGQTAICRHIPKLTKGPWLRELAENGIWINDIQSSTTDVDILVGGDLYGSFMTGKIVHLRCGFSAFETIFGWTLIGSMQNTVGLALSVTNLFVREASVSDLWNLETIGIMEPAESVSKAEREEFSREHFQRNVKINDEGRYEVSLPWVVAKTEVPSNKEIAQRRLTTCTEKLRTNGKFTDYANVFDEWLSEDLIEVVSKNEINAHAHYLPHRPVFKNSETTPVRPVFDASCKTGSSLSLNDCLEKGPNLLELIPSIILRFREKKIGVTADIRRAFMMISVCPDDRNFLRFLWWDKDKTIVEYRHKRVVFGVNCSPFLLAAVINTHLDLAVDRLREAAEILRGCLYVDNCVTSVNTMIELENFRGDAIELMSSAKMDLRCWQNSAVVNASSESQAEKVVGILGLKWDIVKDTLSCDIPEFCIEGAVTKRIILSVAQRIYDPMGYMAPATLLPKLLLQEVWISKIGWDVELSKEQETSFKVWTSQVRILAQIQIPRWVTVETAEKNSWSLHVFCDASQKAYAAAVFLRSLTTNGPCVQLLQAKNRIAPAKRVTIPRLELLSCLIAARLATSVKKGLRCSNISTTFWSDSTTALAWIKGKAVWGIFVRNRVNEILTTTRAEEWRHVPGTLNAADLPSRGCLPSKLVETRWWEGPTFLLTPESDWPAENPEVDNDLVKSEARKKVLVTTVQDKDLWYMRRFSSYTRVIRVVGWIRRFIGNVRSLKRIGDLSVVEINESEGILIKCVQQECFLKRKDYGNIQTMVDENGLLRVVTKISRKEDKYDFRFPILLPSNHPLVELLVRETHEKNCHAGVQILMSKLREKFWILRSRKTIRKIKGKCVRCKRHEETEFQTEPASLPKDRVDEALVFQITGVDLAGPLFLKNGEKAWIVLFTCAVYRAIHLELVTSLSTECFMQALRRFIARRGRPTTIYSDNGTNFVGTENSLRILNWDYITKNFTTRRITWKFNPPSAAWWGGWWERLIRMVKQLLVRTLGKSLLYYEELMTVLCDIEAVLNARPLTYVSEDPEGLRPLTPSMFLQEVNGINVADLDQIASNTFQKRLRLQQRLRDDLRMRFRKEYLGQLVQRYKETNRRIRVGDVVIIEVGSKKRIEWPLGKVIETYPGRDGQVRVVRLKTASGELVRPVARLYLVEADMEGFHTDDKLPVEHKEIQTEEPEEEELVVGDKVSQKPVPDYKVPNYAVTHSRRKVKMPRRYLD